MILATTLAAGLIFPSLQVAVADGPTPTPELGPESGLTISVETVEQLTGLTAIVVGDEDVDVRAEPTDDSDSLATIPDGTTVNLRVDVIDTVYDSFGVRWWPVAHDGAEGWIAGAFLTQATTADGDIVSSRLVAFEYTEQATAHSTARVFGNGQNVNVRAEPASTSEIVTKAADGEVVSLRIDMVDTVYDDQETRWWPVTVNGLDGWISGFYLSDSDGAPTSSPGTDPATSTPGTTAPDVTAVPTGDVTTPVVTVTPTGEAPTGFAAGDFLQVFTGDGESVNVRANGSPTAEITGQFADGEVVRVVSGPVSFESSEAGWYEVTNNNATGFVDGDLLITSVESIASPTPTMTPTPTEPPLSEEEEATVAVTQQPTATATAEPTEDVTEEATTAPEPTEASSTGFIYPLASYTKTQAFGCSNLGFYSYNEEYGCPLHDGLDLAAPLGTPLLAAGSGTVVTAGWCNCGLGYYVEIDHGDGVHTLYGHMASQPYVRAGESVSQGDVIGPLGSTGISTGPHVHFMVKVNGVSRNPEDFLP
ncbi:MAG: peptidoglycan DD-metalloendopeptidase family protein [Chloroflexota bacterium]|nr:peptidoglycan DD-metalloendopeptidase family protein [Chloroflexota bacterium]